jgi:hypothetical protein
MMKCGLSMLGFEVVVVGMLSRILDHGIATQAIKNVAV